MLYDKFQQYRWDEVDGYMPDSDATKKIAGKVIDEILEVLYQWDLDDDNVKKWWADCRTSLNAL